MGGASVVLVPVNSVDRGALDYVRREAPKRFPGSVAFRVVPWVTTLPLTIYNFSRMQYNAALVNSFLAEHFEGIRGGSLVVGVVEGDGYVEGLNFVFGLASPQLGVASVYTARLRFGGDPLLFRERLLKVVIHEIGHLLGLGHCNNECVMRFSNSLSDLDAKPSWFCPECTLRLKSILGG